MLYQMYKPRIFSFTFICFSLSTQFHFTVENNITWKYKKDKIKYVLTCILKKHFDSSDEFVRGKKTYVVLIKIIKTDIQQYIVVVLKLKQHPRSCMDTQLSDRHILFSIRPSVSVFVSRMSFKMFHPNDQVVEYKIHSAHRPSQTMTEMRT